MCNAWNHPYGCMCGFGGEGHLGRRYGSSNSNYFSYSYSQSMRDLAMDLGYSLIFPTTCRYCGELIYLFANPNGGFAIFDEIGGSWPKHQCWGISHDSSSYNSLSDQFSQNYKFPIPSNAKDFDGSSGTISGIVIKKSKSDSNIVANEYELFDGKHILKFYSTSELDEGLFITGNISKNLDSYIVQNISIIQNNNFQLEKNKLFKKLKSTRAIPLENVWELQIDLNKIEGIEEEMAMYLKSALESYISGYKFVAMVLLILLIQLKSSNKYMNIKMRKLKTLIYLTKELNLLSLMPYIESKITPGVRNTLDDEIEKELFECCRIGELKISIESNKLKNFDSYWHRENKYAKIIESKTGINISKEVTNLRLVLN